MARELATRERDAAVQQWPAYRPAGTLTRVWKMLRRHRLAAAGLVVVGLLVGSAIFADLVAPYPPLQIAMPERLQPPSLRHPLGTDDFGRDVLSRIIHGSRISLQVGAIAVGIALSVGVVLGITAGYVGGRTDSLIMRAMDVVLAFPAILLAIAIMAILGPGTVNVMIAIGIVYIPIFARVVRASTLQVKAQEYVEAARALGASDGRVVLRHVLPGTIDTAVVQASLSLAFAILAEAALSFLGLGTQPPTPSWGAMLAQGREWIERAPWLTLFPGAAIFVTVLALNVIGDGLRDALDPRLRM
ncbi:MAG: ABC transporter permease [Armatimonadota bacterium]|nr:ABC transporter permease [Armatimonadota bacterium]